MKTWFVLPKQHLLWSRSAAVWAFLLFSPLVAKDQSTPSQPSSGKVAELRKRVEGDNRNNPLPSVRWGEEALGLLAAEKDPKSEFWFLSMLVHDLNTLDDYAKATRYLERARALVALTRDERDRCFLEVEASALFSNEKNAGAARMLLEALLPSMETYRKRFPQDIEFGRLLARGYRILGGAFMNLGNLQEAILAYARGQKLCNESGDRSGQARILDQIGTLYSLLGRFDEAVASHRGAIGIAESIGDLELQAVTHLAFAKTLGLMNATDAQLQELTSASKLAIRTQDADIQSISTVNLADVYLRKKDYKAALECAEVGLRLTLNAKDAMGIAVCQVNRGIALNRLGHGAEGIKSIQEGLTYFKAIQVFNDLTEITGNLAEEYAFNGNFREAFETERQFKVLSDSLKRSEDLKRIAVASAAFENDKHQIQIAALQRDQKSQTKLRVLWIALGALGCIVIGILIVSRKKLEAANRALTDMSLTDPLTSLGNRRYLSVRIAEDLAQIHRLQYGMPKVKPGRDMNLDVTFLMIDIDHFKMVNDQYGHAAGDKMLQQFAGVLAKVMRDSDTLVRWGGEEFLVVAKSSSQVDANLVAERIRSQVEAFPFDLGAGQVIHRTCSIGFSSYPFYRSRSSEVVWDKVVEVADRCLYAAKAMGRNTWVGIRAGNASTHEGPVDLQDGFDVVNLVQMGIVRAESRGDQPILWGPWDQIPRSE